MAKVTDEEKKRILRQDDGSGNPEKEKVGRTEKKYRTEKEDRTGNGKFEYDEVDVDKDEQTKKDLARIAEIEERNEKMERVRLDREKVVGADVEKKVQNGVQIKTYSVAEGADTVYNVRTESEIDKELTYYQKRMQYEQEHKLNGEMESSEISAEEAAAAIRIDPEEVAEKLALIVKDDRIVCIGDSITYGYEVDGSQTWIGRLRRENEINLLNVGVNGDTTEGMLTRFKEHVIDLNPKAVLIMGGGNDILGGNSLEYVTNNVATMAQMALDKGIVPMIGVAPEPSPKDVPEEWKTLMNYDLIREELATYKEWLITFAKANLLPYVDFDSGLKSKLRSGYGRYFFDGIHPNPAGHKIMASVAREFFQELGLLPKPEEDDRFAL